MRQKRSKAYKRQITLYNHTFKFREPYQILIDGELVLTCEKASFDIAKGLNRTVHGETKPMITQCCMQFLYGTENQKAIDIAKRFERRRCNHPPSSPLPPSECIKSISDVNGENKFRYIIATQDHDLRKALRKVPGIPLIHMNRSVMVMEHVSDATTNHIQKVEREKLTKGLNDSKAAGFKRPAEENSDESKPEQGASKKKKGPKAPNPLSMKKKKKAEEVKPSKVKKRRKRHHKTTNGEATSDQRNSDGEYTGDNVEHESFSDLSESESN